MAFWVCQFCSTCTSQVVHGAAVHERERLLSYTISVQRFIGVTADVVDQGRLRIHYETCYKGTHLMYVYTLEINLQVI